jgi:ABC-type hemin transport system substrate-binding protein
MRSSRVAPKVVLWWGVGLALGGGALIILLPNLAYTVATTGNNLVGVDQGLLMGVDFVVRILSAIVAPLGTALIGAGIVMFYLRQLLQPAGGDDLL